LQGLVSGANVESMLIEPLLKGTSFAVVAEDETS